jgi:WhiB family redox-sensing transcriptional regulator
MWQTWEDLARCKGSSPAAFFPYTETEASLKEVQTEFCDLCPVRGQCLARALVNEDSGYYGGTSTAQRRAMARTRTRAKCPVCRNTDVVPAEPFQICTCCGTSWKADGTLAALMIQQVADPYRDAASVRRLSR